MELISAVYDDHGPFMESGLFSSFLPNAEDPRELHKDACLVVWGGADIHPSLYNHVNHGRTGAGVEPSWRDQVEWALMKRAVELGIPIIGVCRGAQMLCALAGGYLIQDVSNHGGWGHSVTTPDGRSFKVNSIHHQMMHPWSAECEVLAWCETRSKTHWIDKNGEDVSIDLPIEPEYIYYPSVKGFAIQWHPEMMDYECEATEYIFETMKERL